MQILLKENLRS